MNDVIEAKAREIHKAVGNPFLPPWEELSEEKKEERRKQARWLLFGETK